MTGSRLTEKDVKKAKPGVYLDGEGLRLRVEKSGSKRWIVRVTFKGRRQEIGLGSPPKVSLVAARDAAREAHREARAGSDPLAQRRMARAGVLSFEAAAEEVYAARVGGWRSDKHRQQWIGSLRQHVFPRIGKMPVGDVDDPDVLKVLAPIWTKKPDTARRVRQRISTVLDWARIAGHRPKSLVNAADDVEAGLPKQPPRDKHYDALPWRDVPAFAATLRSSNSSGPAPRLALEFKLLTASRTREVRIARWSEIDMADKLWTAPAQHMKGNVEHYVPLSDRCIEILQEAREHWPDSDDSDLIFPGNKPGSPMDESTIRYMMKRLGHPGDPHGLRSSFSDWAADNSWPDDLVEKALAHKLPSRTKRAYRRTELVARRREMMDAWAVFVCGLPLPTVQGDLVRDAAPTSLEKVVA
jgi:integrase